MTIIEFKEFLRDIGIYYERKAPNDGTTESWFERVKNIPGESVGWITDKIYDSFEAYPKNIPNTMWAFYREWMTANPHKVVSNHYFQCPACDGEGLITISKKVNGYDYDYVARCSRCKQSDINGIPYMSREDAEKGGYSIIAQPHQTQIPTHAKSDVEAIIYRLAHKSKMEADQNDRNAGD